jgi:hypothetical protein
MHEFFATYGRGCLDFVKNELVILQNLFKTQIEIQNDKLEGKILFKTNLLIEKLIHLKTIERLILCKLFLITNDQKNITDIIENELDFGQDLKEQLENYKIIESLYNYELFSNTLICIINNIFISLNINFCILISKCERISKFAIKHYYIKREKFYFLRF